MKQSVYMHHPLEDDELLVRNRTLTAAKLI